MVEQAKRAYRGGGRPKIGKSMKLIVPDDLMEAINRLLTEHPEWKGNWNDAARHLLRRGAEADGLVPRVAVRRCPDCGNLIGRERDHRPGCMAGGAL